MYIHNIDPVAFQIGPLSLHWYGFMYLVGFMGFLIFSNFRLKKYPHINLTSRQLTDFVTVFCVLGVIVGGRLGYVFFYGFERFIENPLYLFKVWEGGMSFHGGLIGVTVAVWLYCRIQKIHVIDFTDYLIVGAPIGLMCGRIGNFIGGELWGMETDLPWGVIFPRAGEEPRHPSQLYEAALEGLLLWLLLWILANRPRPRMFILGVFFAGYAVARIAVEFVRVPDEHIGYLAGGFVTMGMVLTSPMLVAGVLIIILSLIFNSYPPKRTARPRSTTTKRKKHRKTK